MNHGHRNQDEKNWLVKSSTRILGPFHLSEVIEHLKSKQISIIDEIRLPEGRWSYIRENAEFMEIVRNIREEQDATLEQTMTQSIAQHTMTRSDVTPPVRDDLTPALPQHMYSPPPVRDIKDVTPNSKMGGFGRKAASKSYGTSSDSRLQNKLRTHASLLRWAMIGAAAIVLVGVGITLSQKDRNKTSDYGDLMAQAIRYKSIGLYQKSLAAYQKAAQVREPDPEVQVQMAGVLISEDRQSLLGRRILEKAIMQEGRSRNDTVDAYLGIAVSYMMDGDLKQAEDILTKATGHDPSNVYALLNLAIIELKKGNYGQAMTEFDAIYRKNLEPEIALLGKSISAVEYARKRSDTSILHNLIRDIDEALQKTSYLRQELMLFSLYSKSLLGDVDAVNQTIVRFLSEMPGQTKNYVHPIQVDWRFMQWDYLEKYCNEAFKKQPAHSELKALRAVCLMEVNRDGEAAKILQEALSETPRDPYVLITQANYLTKIGKQPEAMALLKMPELSSLTAKSLLQGSMCIAAQDLNCAQSAYSQAYNKDKKSPLALYGLAWSAYKNSDRPKAYEFVRAGLQYESNFIPLLELRDEMETQ